MLKIVMPMNFFGYIMCANLISENDAVKNQLLSSVYCNRSMYNLASRPRQQRIIISSLGYHSYEWVYTVVLNTLVLRSALIIIMINDTQQHMN